MCASGAVLQGHIRDFARGEGAPRKAPLADETSKQGCFMM